MLYIYQGELLHALPPNFNPMSHSSLSELWDINLYPSICEHESPQSSDRWLSYK